MAAKLIKQYTTLRIVPCNRIKELKEIALDARNSSNRQRHVEFKAAFESLSTIIGDFDKYHAKLLETTAGSSDEVNLEEFDEVRKEFDSGVSFVRSVFIDLFGDLNSDTKTGSVNKLSGKLPKITLPTFDGNWKSWPSFRDLFESLVHNHDALDNIEKFQYLLMSLSGEPLTLVKSIPLEAANYVMAYETLKKRYQNRRLLATSYFSALTKLPRVTMETMHQLRFVLDSFSENISALNNLDLPTQQWDFVLFNMLSQKIDSMVIKRFEIQYDAEDFNNDIPTYKQLFDFLEKQCLALDTVSFTHPEKINKKPFSSPSAQTHSRNNKQLNLLAQENNGNQLNCVFCKKSHTIFQCNIFDKKSPKERYDLVKQKKLCLNCLGFNHKLSDCPSDKRCKICKASHHTLLHFNNEMNIKINKIEHKVEPQQGQFSQSNDLEVSQVEHSTQVSLASTVGANKLVLLSTAIIKILDNSGVYRDVRVLFDSGSQVNIITERCRKLLNLPLSDISVPITGLGKNTMQGSYQVTCKIKPVGSTLPVIDLEAVVLPRICTNIPNSYIKFNNLNHISNLKLADPTFNVPGAIDMLLNADIFFSCLLDGRISGNENEPVAINTKFGWILSGTIDLVPERSFHSLLTLTTFESLDSTLKRFWELEEIPKSSTLTADEISCENFYKSSVSRDSEGRYTVSLPFKEENPCFESSRSIAMRRYFSLERRLKMDPILYKSYSDFMQDYLDCNHMSPSCTPTDFSHCYYIPHHCVLKPESTTTKLRVVFDASAKSNSGMSLNDSLFVGPKLQKDISSLLLTFRYFKFAITSDIKQMYRQILITSSQRDYQRILWRFSSDQPVQEFRLNTVTYGVASSPYLALRTLVQLANDEQHNFPLASEVLKSQIFVDDILTGSDTLEGAIHLQNELVQLLKIGGFELRKWASNEPKLLQNVPKEDQNSILNFDKEDNFVKILGLRWNPLSDHYSYNIQTQNKTCTKRSILSDLSRIFDPLGYCSPVTFKIKHLMQHLWMLGLSWDEIVPDDIVQLWTRFQAELPQLANIKIPRCIAMDSGNGCEIHGFCDASMKGFGACVYFRFSSPHRCVLITAKSKVAPLKTVSLPRLELCAAVLLSDLIVFVLTTFKTKYIFSSIFAWSDSMVTLAWIKSSPNRWKTFIGNRVSRIHENVNPSCWHYVPSEENPADCLSRGLWPSEIINFSLWWSGPQWLMKPNTCWANLGPDTLDSKEGNIVSSEERHISLLVNVETHELDWLLTKFSSLDKLVHVVAYCLRFLSKIKNKNLTFVDIDVLTDEYQCALNLVVKHVQLRVFKEDIENLKNSKFVSKPLRKLSVFLDERGLIRVGGRLKHSSLSFEQKHPILLPSKHRLTELVIDQFHKKYLHAGLNTLQCLILEQFWILSSKNTIRRCLGKCIRCFRTTPRSIQPIMGNLPPYRVNKVKAFSCVGVDMAGSFPITMSKSRGAKVLKAYFCIFVCYTTKAIHLEPVSDLSTDAFLAALKRFISRRGQVSHLFSDCGTNFVGASKEILSYFKDAALQERIKWSFNPPSAPHFGGLWETGVKSVKSHFSRVIGHQTLTYEEFYTVLVQIESILNSRPLCSLSSDPNDLSVLTPGHFLNLSPVSALPEPDITNIKISRLNRWQLLQQMHQHFWDRWHREYLHTLQQRQKWLKDSQPTVSEGTLVVIKNELAPPLKWRLARIIKLHPGSDGIARVATVRTANGVFQRPLVKLCPLPNQ